MAGRICPSKGCPTIIPAGTARCAPCTKKAEQRRRPNGNPYATTAHRQQFRAVVLTRDPICVICQRAPSTIADHHPRERRDLLMLGLNPNDPNYGRGLCKTCHDKHTAATSPGGWNNRD